MSFFKNLFGKKESPQTTNTAINFPKEFQLSDLKLMPNAAIKDEFALWWPSADEKAFANSLTKIHNASILKLIETHHSLFVGYLLKSVGVIQEIERILLPKNEQAHLLSAPNKQEVLLRLSEEKGIQFLFKKTTTKEYREKLLKEITHLFYAISLNVKTENVGADLKALPHLRENFLKEVEQVKEKEDKGEFIEHFGLWQKPEAKIQFAKAEMSEEAIKEMALKPKDVKLSIEENGAVSALCKECQKEMHLNDKDGLVWFICTSCSRFTFYPLANVQRDVHFAQQDGKPFEPELYYLKELPEGLNHPFQ